MHKCNITLMSIALLWKKTKICVCKGSCNMHFQTLTVGNGDIVEAHPSD